MKTLNHFFILIAAIAMIGLINSCSNNSTSPTSSTNNNNNNNNNTKKGSMSYDISGTYNETITADSTHFHQPIDLSQFGYTGTQVEGLTLAQSTASQMLFTLSETNKSVTKLGLSGDSTHVLTFFAYKGIDFTPYNGNLTFTTINQTEAQGTFSFDASGVADDGVTIDTLSVKNGKFHVYYNND